jgi:hypothetical protein
MPKLIPLIFFMLFATIAVAQQTQEFTFDKTDTLLHCRYSSLKAVDLRIDKGDMGYVRPGARDKSVRLTTAIPLDEYISVFFSKLLAAGSKSELVVLIYGFRVEDKPGGEEIGTIYLDLDFYAGDDGRYSFLGTVDTLYEIGNKRDVTERLLAYTQYMLADGILAFINSAPAVGAPAFTWEQIKEKRKSDMAKYPVYNTADFKKGIYVTARDFIDGTPLDTPFEKGLISSGNTAYSVFFYLNEKGKKGKQINVKKYFAVYDKAGWFCGGGDRPVKMEHRDGQFYTTLQMDGFSVKPPPDLRSHSPNGGIYINLGNLFSDETEMFPSVCNYEVRFDPAALRFTRIRKLKTEP